MFENRYYNKTRDYHPFGMRMSQRSSNSSEYRYGFNGMEKDDEVKGEGNSYDFGARIYDPRIGRWLSLDPLQAKYPNLSPYNFVSNSPTIFVDPDGKENVIYLTDLRLTDPELSLKDKNQIIADLQKIADAANNGFESKGLTPRVVVIDFVPKANELEKSDVLATLGTKAQLVEFDDNYAENAGYKKEGDYDVVGAVSMGPEQSTSIGGSGGDAGDRIALDTDQIKNGYKKQLYDNQEDYAAWLIQHGSGHNAAVAHSDGYSESANQEQALEGNDMMTSGPKNNLETDKGKSYRNKVGPILRILFVRKKFTPRPAKDNLNKN